MNSSSIRITAVLAGAALAATLTGLGGPISATAAPTSVSPHQACHRVAGTMAATTSKLSTGLSTAASDPVKAAALLGSLSTAFGKAAKKAGNPKVSAALRSAATSAKAAAHDLTAAGPTPNPDSLTAVEADATKLQKAGLKLSKLCGA